MGYHNVRDNPLVPSRSTRLVASGIIVGTPGLVGCEDAFARGAFGSMRTKLALKDFGSEQGVAKYAEVFSQQLDRSRCRA
jgi:hypothetical protein